MGWRIKNQIYDPPKQKRGGMCIQANKNESQENHPTMTHEENSNNKPGLALFTIECDIYDETYTYITALPYKGKLKGYIHRIHKEANLLSDLAYDMGTSANIHVAIRDFGTYAEAKAAAQGATFMDVDENAGMSPVGEVDAEKLQKVVEIMERIRGNIQLTGDEEQDKKEARDAVIAVASETGLWLNPND